MAAYILIAKGAIFLHTTRTYTEIAYRAMEDFTVQYRPLMNFAK